MLNLIEVEITPEEIAGVNKVVTAPERLALTLWFLATREALKSLSFQFCICDGDISYIVKCVCQATVKHLNQIYLSAKITTDEWINILDIADKLKISGNIRAQ